MNKTTKRLLIIAAILLGCILLFLPVLYGASVASRGALSARQALEQLPAALDSQDFEKGRAALAEAEAGVVEIQRGLKSFGAWRYTPYIGAKVRALEEVGKVGERAIIGARDLLAVAADMKEALDAASLPGQLVSSGRSYRELTKAERMAAMNALYQRLPQMRKARESLTLAAETWSQLPQDELLRPLRTRIAPYADKLSISAVALTEAIDLLEWMIPLSGIPEKKSYLVALQNSDELRPTGGFIGTIGMVTVEAGNVESIEFEDVYSLDRLVEGKWNEAQPLGLAGQFGNKVWYLRDANWSPDGPRSAETMRSFYIKESQIGRGKTPTVDGVIFLTPAIFKKLITLTGPITIEGRVFDADNFFDKLQYDVEMGFLYEGVPDAQRKGIVKQVGQALIQRIMSLPSTKWPELLSITTDSLNKQDIFVTTIHPEIQKILDARFWSGRVRKTDGDYLWVIDGNVNARKTDGQMDKNVEYKIERIGDRYQATVLLRYRNPVEKEDWRYTRYRSFTRVYVPEGIEFIDASGCKPEVYLELGKRVMGCHWEVPLSSVNTLSFRYWLPAAMAKQIEDGEYTLLAQKQPGADRELTLDLSFGKKVSDASPAEAKVEWGDEVYHHESAWDATTLYTISF